jgi:hypothetical protein
MPITNSAKANAAGDRQNAMAASAGSMTAKPMVSTGRPP